MLNLSCEIHPAAKTPHSYTSRKQDDASTLRSLLSGGGTQVPIPDGKAGTVKDVPDQRMFSYICLPEQIYSDLGTQFGSKLLTELFKIREVKKTQTSSYHPQGNHIEER